MQSSDLQKVIKLEGGGSKPGHKFEGNQYVTVPGEEVFVHEEPKKGKHGETNFSADEAFENPQKLIDHNQDTADKVAKLLAGNWQAVSTMNKEKRANMAIVLNNTKPGGALSHLHPLDGKPEGTKMMLYRGGNQSTGVRSWTSDPKVAESFAEDNMYERGTEQTVWGIEIDRNSPALDINKTGVSHSWETVVEGKSYIKKSEDEHEVVLNTVGCKNKPQVYEKSQGGDAMNPLWKKVEQKDKSAGGKT